MEGDNLKILIAAFVTLIVGISLLVVIAGEGNNVTERINVANESIDLSVFRNDSGTDDCNVSYAPVAISNVPSGWQLDTSYGCGITDFTMDFSNGTDLTNGTDYVFYANNGTWKCINSLTFNYTSTNTTSANYTYCPTNYLTQSWSRTMVDVVPGFFALALIAVAIGLFYVILRREGLINI